MSGVANFEKSEGSDNGGNGEAATETGSKDRRE